MRTGPVSLTVRVRVAFAFNPLSLNDVLAQDGGHVLGMFDCRLDAGVGVKCAVLLEALSDLVLGGRKDMDVACIQLLVFLRMSRL